jgi:hypothetical protein
VVIVSASLLRAECPPGAVAALKKPTDIDELLGVLAACELSSAAESA